MGAIREETCKFHKRFILATELSDDKERLGLATSSYFICFVPVSILEDSSRRCLVLSRGIGTLRDI